MGATGGHFSEIEVGGVTHTGCMLTTSDEEIGKWPPSLRVAVKIQSVCVVVLVFGTTKLFGLRLA
jgi:hypothetical protein